MPSEDHGVEGAQTETLTEIRERGAMDCAGTDCTYCGEETGDCRPMPVDGRDYVPRLCNGCYRALDAAARLDRERDRQLFYPDDHRAITQERSSDVQ